MKPFFLLALLAVIGCNDLASVELKVPTIDNLTQQFEDLKGQMTPVENYDSIILNQNTIPLSRTACITFDRQIYVCRHACNIKSVSDGQIKRIIRSELGTMVIIKSGIYFTIYRNVNNVVVTEGVFIKKGGLIGQVPEAEPSYFELYAAKAKKLNLSDWLRI